MSVPALVISLNALGLGQQQRADALAQRAEDKRKEEQAKAEADALTKIAFPTRVRIVNEDYGTVPDAWSWNVRNANSQRAYVYVLHRPNKQPTELWEFVVEPCSEGEMVLPASKSKLDTLGGSQTLAIAKRDTVSTRQQLWTRPILSAEPQPITDWSKWIGLETQPDGGITIEPGSIKRIQRGITPCT
ncbi:hypothetical protein Nocox_18435 [Nonomuraea coxensis DSM 45129]|uniref:Uncharacterized protein n=2 Tax=Nonomuraea coxensis TaxID=404386 RepID=A0ABX8U328_9ACTN|nr:hypothetical protein [Nonomuraea coxensis]QYC41296.1 hypothetical protein Nocox_18435 [Nonomuraea coxensis DSM 45129]